jgi:hypothetical protein
MRTLGPAGKMGKMIATFQRVVHLRPTVPWRPSVRRVDGLRRWQPYVPGARPDGFSNRPQFSVHGYLATWEDDAASVAFLAGPAADRFGSAAEYWYTRMQPWTTRGTWPRGELPFAEYTGVRRGPGADVPVAFVSTARTRPWETRRFLAVGPLLPTAWSPAVRSPPSVARASSRTWTI